MLTKYTLLAALASLSSCAFAAPFIGIENAHPAPLEARYTPSGLWNGFYVKIQDGRRFRRPAFDGDDWLTKADDARFVSVNDKGEFADRSFEVDSAENGLFKCDFIGNLQDPSQAAPTFTFGRNKLYYETVRGVSVSCTKP